MDLELKVGQVMKELWSLQEVLVGKEAEFIQTSTAKEQELEETVTKLQVAEAELENMFSSLMSVWVWLAVGETIPLTGSMVLSLSSDALSGLDSSVLSCLTLVLQCSNSFHCLV